MQPAGAARSARRTSHSGCFELEFNYDAGILVASASHTAEIRARDQVWLRSLPLRGPLNFLGPSLGESPMCIVGLPWRSKTGPLPL
jgi:hypothetical protein